MSSIDCDSSIGQGTRFTVTLPEGLKWANGNDLTSADVKFTLERIARKGSDSPLVAQLEAVTGFAAYTGAGTAPGLAGVEAPDPLTVVFKTTNPTPLLPNSLSTLGVLSAAKEKKPSRAPTSSTRIPDPIPQASTRRGPRGSRNVSTIDG